jgi:hypothetical protein
LFASTLGSDADAFGVRRSRRPVQRCVGFRQWTKLVKRRAAARATTYGHSFDA